MKRCRWRGSNPHGDNVANRLEVDCVYLFRHTGMMCAACPRVPERLAITTGIRRATFRCLQLAYGTPFSCHDLPPATSSTIKYLFPFFLSRPRFLRRHISVETMVLSGVLAFVWNPISSNFVAKLAAVNPLGIWRRTVNMESLKPKGILTVLTDTSSLRGRFSVAGKALWKSPSSSAGLSTFVKASILASSFRRCDRRNSSSACSASRTCWFNISGAPFIAGF